MTTKARPEATTYIKKVKLSEDDKIKKWLDMSLLFGKYKNSTFKELLEDKTKKDYLIWLNKQDFLKDSLRIIILKLLNYHDSLIKAI